MKKEPYVYLSLVIGRKNFHIALFNRLILALGGMISLLDKALMLRITEGDKGTYLPYIYFTVIGVPRLEFSLGKRPGFDDEFNIVDVKPVEGSEPRDLILEGYEGQYCDGTALYVYNDGRKITREVFYIFYLKNLKTGALDDCVVNYTPVRRRDGTMNKRPEPILRLLLGLAESIGEEANSRRGSMTE